MHEYLFTGSVDYAFQETFHNTDLAQAHGPRRNTRTCIAGMGCEAAMQLEDSPSDCTGDEDESRRCAELVGVIEGEILPRLLLLCRSSGPAARAQPAARTGDDEAAELARLLVAHGANMAREFIEAVRQSGVPYPVICTELLAPAARQLVDRWEQRDLGYGDLANGLDALRAVVSDIGGPARSARRPLMTD